MCSHYFLQSTGSNKERCSSAEISNLSRPFRKDGRAGWPCTSPDFQACLCLSELRAADVRQSPPKTLASIKFVSTLTCSWKSVQEASRPSVQPSYMCQIHGTAVGAVKQKSCSRGGASLTLPIVVCLLCVLHTRRRNEWYKKDGDLRTDISQSYWVVCMCCWKERFTWMIRDRQTVPGLFTVACLVLQRKRQTDKQTDI